MAKNFIRHLILTLGALLLLAVPGRAQTFTFYGPLICSLCMGNNFPGVSVSAGDFVALWIYSTYLTPGSFPVSDSLGNTWRTNTVSPNWSEANGSQGSQGVLIGFGCSGITSGGSDTVHAQNGGGPLTTTWAMSLIVVHGGGLTCSFTTDDFLASESFAANPSQALTLANSNDIVFSTMASDASSVGNYSTPGMTQIHTDATLREIWGVQTNPPSGAYNVTTSGGTTGNYVFLTLAFGSSNPASRPRGRPTRVY